MNTARDFACRRWSEWLQYVWQIRRSTARVLATFAAVLALTPALGGCRSDDQMSLLLDDPARRHAITFDRASERLIIEAPEPHDPLSGGQVFGIHKFLRHYKRQSSGSLYISSPRNAGGRHAVKPVLRRLHQIMQEMNIEPSRVRLRSHRNRSGWPTVHLSYQRPVKVAPQCGDWSEDLAVNRERIHYPNYGCATQRNLAATVANARDLLRPRDVSPRSSERRGTTWSEYVRPEKKKK